MGGGAKERQMVVWGGVVVFHWPMLTPPLWSIRGVFGDVSWLCSAVSEHLP